jgi:unsaturated rhamnogalacturonyl hydrolase
MRQDKDLKLNRTKEIKGYIDLLVKSLSEIKDDGQLLQFKTSGVIVDDKSWNVWNWPQGVGLYGLYKYYQMSDDKNAYNLIVKWFEEGIDYGTPDKNVNTMAPLLAMAYLYEETANPKYKPYLEEWAKWAMYQMPRTLENGLQHMTYGHAHDGQLWDDTLVMTVLPLAKIGKLLNNKKYLEEAKRQFLIHAKYLLDVNTGLFFHAWDFNGRHNFAKALWARGNAWITIAIPEIIDILELEEQDALRVHLIQLLECQVEALAKYQSESGLWHTLINDDTSYVEASATAGFAYGILRAIHERYIDEKYKSVALKAIEGIIDNIDENGALKNVSIGTGASMDIERYKKVKISPMPYGQALSILCLSEYLREFM